MSQIHPQHDKDLAALQALSDPSDLALAELARLYIRYLDFNGAEDIQRKIKNLLTEWQLTPDELFSKTREIHTKRPVFRGDSARQDDWA